jgi:hypothetical protein
MFLALYRARRGQGFSLLFFVMLVVLVVFTVINRFSSPTVPLPNGARRPLS